MATTIHEFAQRYAGEIKDSVSIVRKSAGQSDVLRQTVLHICSSINNLRYEDDRKITPNDIKILLDAIDKYLGIRIGTMNVVEKSIQSAVAFEEALALLKLQIEASGQQ